MSAPERDKTRTRRTGNETNFVTVPSESEFRRQVLLPYFSDFVFPVCGADRVTRICVRESVVVAGGDQFEELRMQYGPQRVRPRRNSQRALDNWVWTAVVGAGPLLYALVS